MADEFDVEALLEAPYTRQANGGGGQDDYNSQNNMTNGVPDYANEYGSRHNNRHSTTTAANTSNDNKSHTDSRNNERRSRDKSSSRRRSRSRRRSGSKSRRSEKSREIKSSGSKRRSRSRHKSRSPRSKRHGSKSHHSSKTREKSPPRRSRSHHSKSKRSSKSKHRSRSKEIKHRSRSGSKDKKRRRRSLTPISLPGRSRNPYMGPPPYPRFRKYSPPYGGGGSSGGGGPGGLDELTPEERDARTIFCMQLSQRIRAKDLEDFFSSVGKVRDIRLITCNKTHRFKGIAYIEFKDPESVTLALGLNGQKLLDIPIIVQPTQAEKNRVGNSMPSIMPRGHLDPVRLYVGSLHHNITEDMLRGIFEPFGKIDTIHLVTDPETGRSRGYGFVTYHNADDAKKALEQMNGFELAGKPMKVNSVSDRHDTLLHHQPSLDTDELDRAGIELGATGRLQLMYKLAEGTGMEIPPAAANALNLSQVVQSGTPIITQPAPPIATQCFMLANMFDPNAEDHQNWDIDIRDDVIEECNKHGGCIHVFVDKLSPEGNVYVKCPTISTAVAAVNSLHGRWFGGRVITAAYVPILNYHNLFPESITAISLLTTTRKG